MIKIWKTQSAEDMSCKDCGAIYSVTNHRVPIKDDDSFNCECCGHLMKSWNSVIYPELKLKKRVTSKLFLKG